MGQYYTPILFKEETTDFTDTLNLRGAFDTFDYGSGSKLMEHSWKRNPMLLTIMDKIKHFGRVRVVWAGDYADEEPNGKNLYRIISDLGIYTKCSIPPTTQCRYIINHDKKEYVDLDACPDNDGWVIHPLALLTCEGNGRGGGDFHYDDKENGTHYDDYVGRWARNVISVADEAPEEYTEIHPDFVEDW